MRSRASVCFASGLCDQRSRRVHSAARLLVALVGTAQLAVRPAPSAGRAGSALDSPHTVKASVERRSRRATSTGNQMTAGWSPWALFPDPRQGGYLDAPLGPGCYGLRIGDQLVLLRGRNVAVVCRHCCRRHGAAVVGTTRASDKPCSTIWGVVEYRTLACDSRGAAAAEEAKMRTRRSEYLFAT